jgi:hypothetical protein
MHAVQSRREILASKASSLNLDDANKQGKSSVRSSDGVNKLLCNFVDNVWHFSNMRELQFVVES